MSIRAELGDFSSIICFKAVITGVEDVLGKEGAAAVFIQAGRVRGKQLADQLGMTGKGTVVGELAKVLDNAVGLNGTKLCQIKEIKEENGTYIVRTKETICTAGEPAGSDRSCTYTMGAVMGFLEAVLGKNLIGKHVANVLSGSATDDFEFKPV